jgi:polyhydroxyalkanoate synthesis regulator phasin
MKLNELKALIKEELKKVLNENQPATAPSKPVKKPGVKEPPAKSPGKPKPSRPFKPKPGADPNPKAQGKMNENEKKIVDDIVKRFRDKSKNNVDERKEMSPIQIQRLKKISNRLNKNNTPDSLSGSDMANFTNSLKDKYNPIKKSDMPLDKYLASKSKK